MSIMLINPFLLQAIEVITRTFASAGYVATRQTAASNALGLFVGAQQLSTVESGSFDYAILWQGTGDQSTTNADFLVTLFETSARQELNIEPQDVTDALSVGGVYPYSGLTAKTFSVSFVSESGTAGLAGVSLNHLRLESGDLWDFNSGSTTGSAGNGAAAVSVTITTPGDYVIVASGSVDAGGNAAVFDGTTLYGELGVAMNQDSTTFSPYWHVVKLTLTNQTISLRALGTGTTLKQSSILALRVDGFDKSYYASQTTTATTTSSTSVSAFNQTFNISSPQNYHLILASALLNNNATNSSVAAALTNTTRGIRYNITHFREGNNSAEWYPTVVARIVQFADNNPNLSWEFYSESNNTASIKDMSIAIFDLGEQGPPIIFIGTETVINNSSIVLPDSSTNDVVIAISHSTSVSGLNIPTGYTTISNGTVGTLHYQISYKVMGATPDTTVEGFSTGNANIKHMAMVYRGIDATTTFDATPVITSSTQNGIPAPGNITITNPSVIVLIGILDDDNVVADYTPPNEYTSAGAVESSGTIMAAYRLRDTSGTEQPNEFGIGAASDQWVAATIALRRA